MDVIVKDPRPNRRALLVGALIAGGLLVVVSAWSVVSSRAHGSFKTTTVKRGSVEFAVNARAKIVPASERVVSSPGAGNVATLVVKNGDTVKSGDTLVVIEDAQLQLHVDSAVAAFNQAESDLAQFEVQIDTDQGERQIELLKATKALELAEAEFAATSRLAADGVISKVQLAKVSSQRDIAGAELEIAKRRSSQAERVNKLKRDELTRRLRVASKGLEDARRAVDDLSLKSPVDGTVTSLTAKVGESVSLGQALLRVVSGQLSVALDVSELDAARVTIGQKARLSLPNSIMGCTVSSLPGESSGGVVKVDCAIDGQAPASLRSSQSYAAEIGVAHLDDVVYMATPDRARGDADQYLFVIKGDGRSAERRMVRFGDVIGPTAVVASGLNVGDRVVLFVPDELIDNEVIRGNFD